MGLSRQKLDAIANDEYKNERLEINDIKSDEVAKLCEAVHANSYIKVLMIYEDGRACYELPSLCLTPENLDQLLRLDNIESLTIFCSDILKYNIDMKLLEPSLLDLISYKKNMMSLKINCISSEDKEKAKQKSFFEICKYFINNCWQFINNRCLGPSM
jgi:hypothetical protein